MTPPKFLIVFVLMMFALLGGACGEGQTPVGTLPNGWTGIGDKWWVDGADTSRAFRNLEDFESMGVAPQSAVYASRGAQGVGEGIREQVVHAVQRNLLPLYRNEPEIVDSLFDHIVDPELRTASLEDDPDEIIERNKKRAYAMMRRHFREPSPALRLGSDVPVQYPDSLRRKGIGGAVRIQVRLNASGEPIALELTDSIHPTLDHIAMDATTRMRWHPAYLLVRNDWHAVPAWARFAIHFTSSG